MSTTASKPLRLRLVCRHLPPTPAEEGLLDVGIQDKAQRVHAGRAAEGGAIHFECVVEARADPSTRDLDFRGAFVHGTPGSRFLYLSWKRPTAGAAPWYQRVKVPLAGIAETQAWALQGDEVLSADITERRPHAVESITWLRGA